MIDFDNKVIFIHIPRCAGTTIEKAFTGHDYWKINAPFKHAPASIYKSFYKEEWDEYYKFSIVRNPFDRYRSMWKYSKEYCLRKNKRDEIELDRYQKAFGHRIVLEQQLNLNGYGIHSQFIRKQKKFLNNQVYGNYLNEQLDDIFLYENLSNCFDTLKQKFPNLNLNFEQLESSPTKKPKLSLKAEKIIRRICKKDFIEYGYSQEETS